jgi:hypothetical protein
MRLTFNRVWMARCLAASAFVVSVAAHAALWGYVDDAGTPHIATEKLDDRYQLFFKGGTKPPVPNATAVAETEARVAFASSPIFQRVMASRDLHRFERLIEHYAHSQQLEPALVKAVIAVESSFEPDAISAKGAVGLMQIIPGTGERYGVTGDAKRSVAQKLRDPAINLAVGTRYLHDLLALFADDLDLALAAYNAGEQTVKRYDNAIPPFAETRDYVKLVRQFQSFYQPPQPPIPTTIRFVIERVRTPPG